MVKDRQPFPTSQPSKKRSTHYWRWFLPPMLLASVGLHGLVLFAPISPSEEDLVPPPDPEEDGIAITKVDAPQPRPRPPAAANASTVKTARPTPTPSPQPAQTRSSNQPQRAASHSTHSASRAQGRRTELTAAAQASRDRTAQRQPSVPALPEANTVRNPNPTAPSVVDSNASQPTLDVAAATVDPFEEYIKVFETYNGVSISEEEAANLREIWLDSFSDRGPHFSDLEIQPLQDFDSIPYAANICLPSPPETAQVLVMVNPDGEIDEYKQFLQRTGYRTFDNEATKLINSHDFPTTDAPQAYLVEIAVDYDADECQWPPQVDKLPEEYFAVLDNYIGPDLTTPAEAKAAQEAWLKSLKESDDLELSHTDELSAVEFEGFEQAIEYPLEICLPIEPKDAQWGVVVNADGSLLTAPEPLRSTGYQHFDDRAQELVENFDFPAAETPQIYVVEVPVDYNSVNCQRLDSDEFEVPATTTADPASDNDEGITTTAAPRDALAFNPEQQASLIETGRENVEADSVGSLNSLPDIAIASIESGWPKDVDQSCFLSELDPEQGPIPVDSAEDALVLSESSDFVPLTLSRLYGTEVADAGEYCGVPLLEMAVGGTPQLFSSTVGFGAGNSNTLVVIWPADPRAAEGN